MCDERERLIGYVYDEVDAAERAEIDRHVDSCAECRDEIRGLRSVRQDLLAWDVPQHGSVWQPFAPARLRPWWREVPAWAMAVAATIMFLIGAAGGVATRALTDRPAVAATQAAAPAIPAVQVMPATISPADLETVRHEISDLRSEMDQRVRLVSTHASATSTVSDRDIEQLRALLTSGNQRDDKIFNFALSTYNGLVRVTSDQAKRIDSLDETVRRLTDMLAQQQGGKQ